MSGTTRRIAGGIGPFTKGVDRVAEADNRVRAQRVVGPASGPPVGDEVGVAQHLEMEREQWLGDSKVGLQLANAAFSAREELEDSQAGLVSERLAYLCHSRAGEELAGFHGAYHIKIY